ncbi:TPA: nucleotidyltransferase substrate binding protein [Mannheimia haemolytica]|nr:nucleotidyltransferase substrate binding protein [Mannheimia haemolytica]
MEQLDITVLENAFNSLEKTIVSLENQAWFNRQEAIIQDTLIAGAIQKFEFVYELSIKMLKRQLKNIESNDTDIDSTEFRDILRMAAQYGLIESPEVWLDYRKMRNITSHTYDQNKAQQVYNGISNFLESRYFLVKQLQKRNSYD